MIILPSNDQYLTSMTVNEKAREHLNNEFNVPYQMIMLCDVDAVLLILCVS